MSGQGQGRVVIVLVVALICGMRSTSATPVPTSSPVISGGDKYTCAVRVNTGEVMCWGKGDDGQLGDGSNILKQNTPVKVSGLTRAVAVVTGGFHTCALLSTGGAMCWGKDNYGQLGDGGANTDKNTPVDVSGLTGAVAIAAGSYHTCVVLSTGGAKCWGAGIYGQLGDGGSYASKNIPVDVSGLTSAIAIAAGYGHTCAVLSTGGAKCWGQQLGDGGSNTYKNTPVDVSGLTGAVAIAAGRDHTCALLSTGGAKCWGPDGNGQLGDGGSNADKNTPVDVSGLTSAVAITAGDYHTCALLSTGGAKCWGADWKGQLGDGGNNTNKNTPVDVSGLTGAVAIAAGSRHTCAALSTGRVKCWGLGDDGQLGDGSETGKSTPVDVSGLTLAATAPPTTTTAPPTTPASSSSLTTTLPTTMSTSPTPSLLTPTPTATNSGDGSGGEAAIRSDITVVIALVAIVNGLALCLCAMRRRRQDRPGLENGKTQKKEPPVSALKSVELGSTHALKPPPTPLTPKPIALATPTHQLVPRRIAHELTDTKIVLDGSPIPTRPVSLVATMEICKALFDYEATADDELTITAGELLQMRKAGKPGDWCEVSRGRGAAETARGFVPADFVEVVYGFHGRGDK